MCCINLESIVAILFSINLTKEKDVQIKTRMQTQCRCHRPLRSLKLYKTQGYCTKTSVDRPYVGKAMVQNCYCQKHTLNFRFAELKVGRDLGCSMLYLMYVLMIRRSHISVKYWRP